MKWEHGRCGYNRRLDYLGYRSRKLVWCKKKRENLEKEAEADLLFVYQKVESNGRGCSLKALST